ncbi:MAG: ABC transporter substrate-binding protein [Brotaphodocola sp.]
MKKLVSVLLASAMCASVLTACGGGTSSEGNAAGSDAAKTETSAKAGDNSNINIGVQVDLTSLDPQNHNDTTSAYATRHIYNNLVALNEETNEFEPAVAESWEFLDDVTVSFTLKEGVKFHNGETVTAEDVKFSLERQKNSAKVGHLVDMIDNVEVVDDLHFIIHMNTPSNALISSLNHSGAAVLCKSYTEALEAEGKTLESAPMGCGPYKFDSWTPGASFSLVKFDDYYNPDKAAQNDKLTFKVIPEESARTIALENGELDLLLDVGTTDAKRIRESQTLALDEYPTTHVEYLAMNMTKAPFDNLKVRQALNYAINKNDIVIAAIDGEGEVFSGYIGPSAIGYYDTYVTYDNDLEKAKELLAEAGYENGFDFNCYVSNDTRARSATIIQAALAQLGINMTIEQMEASTFYEKTGNGEHDSCLAGWVANAEPDNTYRPLFTSSRAGAGGNRAFYMNPEVDALVDDAATNRDAAAVQKDYEEITKIISEDAIWVPLYSKNGLAARNANLQGFVPSSIIMHDLASLHY